MKQEDISVILRLDNSIDDVVVRTRALIGENMSSLASVASVSMVAFNAFGCAKIGGRAVN